MSERVACIVAGVVLTGIGVYGLARTLTWWAQGPVSPWPGIAVAVALTTAGVVLGRAAKSGGEWS